MQSEQAKREECSRAHAKIVNIITIKPLIYNIEV